MARPNLITHDISGNTCKFWIGSGQVPVTHWIWQSLLESLPNRVLRLFPNKEVDSLKSKALSCINNIFNKNKIQKRPKEHKVGFKHLIECFHCLFNPDPKKRKPRQMTKGLTSWPNYLTFPPQLNPHPDPYSSLFFFDFFLGKEVLELTHCIMHFHLQPLLFFVLLLALPL